MPLIHATWFQPVLPPGKRPRKGKIQRQKPSPPTSGNNPWVPYTPGLPGVVLAEGKPNQRRKDRPTGK